MGPHPWSLRLSETVTDNWDSVFGHSLAAIRKKNKPNSP